MEPKRLSKPWIVISGYIKENISIYIPIIIIDVIYNFYRSNSKIFDSSFKQINPNLTNVAAMICNHLSHFLLTYDNKLYVRDNPNIVKWGNTNPEFQEHLYFKENDIKVTLISQGITSQHTLIYTSKHQLYGFGDNACSQLGMNTMDKNVTDPVLIKGNISGIVKQICCGYNHTLILTKNGLLYGCGYNVYGQLSMSDTDKTYELFELSKTSLKLNNIEYISCGQYSSYVLNNDGILYSFGDNRRGQLGINNKNISKTFNINRIHAHLDDKIETVSAGYDHCAVLTVKLKLYLFGDNSFGKCRAKSVLKIYQPSHHLFRENIIGVKCFRDIFVIYSQLSSSVITK